MKTYPLQSRIINGLRPVAGVVNQNVSDQVGGSGFDGENQACPLLGIARRDNLESYRSIIISAAFQNLDEALDIAFCPARQAGP